MPDSHKNALGHPLDLESGRVLAPGEVVTSDGLNLREGSHDQRLVEDGALIAAYVTPDESLTGDDLQERARALRIKNRSTMSAEELRAKVAEAEAQGGDTATEEADK